MPYMPYHQDPLTSLKKLRSTIFIYNMYIICIFLYHISHYIKFKHDHRVVLMRSQAFGILIWLAISINPERFKSTGLEKNPPRMMLIPNIWNKDPFINTIIMHHAILYYIYIHWLYTVCIYNNHVFCPWTSSRFINCSTFSSKPHGQERCLALSQGHQSPSLGSRNLYRERGLHVGVLREI